MRAAGLLLCAFLLVGLSSASQYNRQQQGNFEVEESDRQQQPKAFRAGHAYSFTYNGQIASGLDTNAIGQSSDEPQQKAVTRIQAQAQISFQSDNQATLRLQKIRVGQLNQELESPQQVQPMEMFENKQIEEQKRRQLELPVQFTYQQGVVQRIQFSADDAIWAKNIKRSVLNLIQLNLNRQGSESNNQQQYELESQEQQQDSQSQQKSFTLKETTIEGECQTTYTLNKNNKQTGRQQQSQEQDQQPREQTQDQLFNVTKSINFKQCSKIADVGYGFQTQQDQPECVRCQQQWYKQQEQLRNGNQQQQVQPNPCQECDPKEIKEQTLDRTTVLRFVLTGRTEDYGIKRAELISQYVYKSLRSDNGEYSSAMQTIVAAELVFRGVQQVKGQQEQGQYESESKQNTLLYDNEWDSDEKRFYMVGDEGFAHKSPFASVTNKVEQAQQILRKLIVAASDKINGIEFDQLVQLQRLVEIFRMCTVQELKEIHSVVTSSTFQTSSVRSETEKQKIEQILADTLAIAGTRNTIFVLVQKISNGELTPIQAVQALKSLTGLVAPSDKQAQIVLNLCKNEAVHRSTALKQTCWLTFGSMVGELCRHRSQKNGQQQQYQQQTFGAQTGFKRMDEEMCGQAKKQSYKEALIVQYEQAESTYEKVLSLKALGNSGITISRLEQIISKPGEDRIVRIQAIDALRRQRTQMARKIQRVLLPIFQNIKEHQEVRMAAFAMIMRTQPEEHIVDQISFTLIKERNAEVQSFVYSTMVALSKSKVPAEQQLAKHLKSTLKLANIDEQSLRSSRKYHVPMFSQEQKEGVFLNLVSVFNSHSMMPAHLSATLDTLLNDQYEMNNVKLAFTQRGMEQWYETLMKNLMKIANERQSSPSRAERSTSQQRPHEQELRQMFSGLKIQKRRSSYYRGGDSQEQQDQQQDSQSNAQNEPFAMICLRVGDVDQVILPIDRHTAPQCLKQLLDGQRPSLSQWVERLNDQQHFRLLSAFNFNEKSAKIATSIGVPLRIVSAMPMLTAIEGSIKINVAGGSIKAALNVHPSLCVAHIQKMESWTPIIATGVESTRAIELNAPIQAEISADYKNGIKVTLKVPEAPKTRVLGLHTLPATYTRDWDSKTKMLREPKVKSIHNPQLEQLQGDVEKKVGEHTLGLPFHVRGHFHWPASVSDYKQVLQLLMATENHVHVNFEPVQGQTPKAIIFRIGGNTFQKSEGGNHGPQLDNFYSQAVKFEKAYPEDDFEDMNLDGQEQSKQKLNTFLGKFNGQMYEHSVRLVAETQGGRKEMKAELRMNGACDQKFKYCKLATNAKRSALYPGESGDWTLVSNIQILRPDAVSSVQQLKQGENQKNQKFVLQSDNQWGCDRKQQINLRIQGEQGQSKHHRQQISRYEGPQNFYQQKRAAFLNKFDVVADYKLKPEAQNFFARSLELVKARNYWATDSQLITSGRDGQVHATLVIDPLSQRYCNVSVKTPSQAIRMLQVQLPTPIRPFSLIRQGDKSSHSPSQLVKRMAEGKGRAECTVDGKKVQTFDQVLYKAPIGKCYSVLAKDCTQETPRFVVLMKSIGSEGKNKKIKIVTPEQTIVCQPMKADKKLECKVNGKTVSPNEQQQSSEQTAVEYNNEEQTDVTITVEGVQVRFGCWCNSCKCQKAWIKISHHYKEGQCGLCGHYDDQAGDELRMSDNQLTTDLSRFHQSYTLQDNEDECTEDSQKDFYAKKNNFQQIDSREHQRYRKNALMGDYSEEGQQQDQPEQEQDNQWLAGTYHGSEEEQTRNTENNWSNKQWRKQQVKKLRAGKNQNQQTNEEQSQEPIEQTKVLEFNHKICFSVQPVKQCPEGTTPEQQGQDEDNYNQSDKSGKKMQFACLNRSDSNARRLQRQARRGVVVTLPDQSPSFVEQVFQPTRCVVY